MGFAFKEKDYSLRLHGRRPYKKYFFILDVRRMMLGSLWRARRMSAVPGNKNRLSKAQIESALTAFSAADWQRANLISKRLCEGVTGWEPSDLLQEALTSFLGENRVWPANLPHLVVLKTAMHSIASNARKHNQASPIDGNVVLDPVALTDDAGVSPVHGRVETTPESILAAKENMVAIYAALGGDEELELLVMAWADGIRGTEAMQELGWDAKKHDAVRNRLVRRLKAMSPDGGASK